MIRTIAHIVAKKARELVDCRGAEREALRQRLEMTQRRLGFAETAARRVHWSPYYVLYTPGTETSCAETSLRMSPPSFREGHDAMIILRVQFGGGAGVHVLKDVSAAFHRLHSKEAP